MAETNLTTECFITDSTTDNNKNQWHMPRLDELSASSTEANPSVGGDGSGDWMNSAS